MQFMSVTVREYEALQADLRAALDLLDRMADVDVGGEASPDYYRLLREVQSFLKEQS